MAHPRNHGAARRGLQADDAALRGALRQALARRAAGRRPARARQTPHPVRSLVSRTATSSGPSSHSRAPSRRHAVPFFCAGRVDRLAGAVRRSADPGARRREDTGGGGACGRRWRRSLRAAAPLPLRSRAVSGRQLAAPPNLAGRGRRDADESGVRCGKLCGMGGHVQSVPLRVAQSARGQHHVQERG